MLFLSLACAFYLVGWLLTVVLLSRAPEGYQDGEGFHVVSPRRLPRIPLSGTLRRRPTWAQHPEVHGAGVPR